MHQLEITDSTTATTRERTMGPGHDSLSQRFNRQLRAIAKQSVTVWFAQSRLDRLLAEQIGSLEGCELMYAIDATGKQMSSNIHPDSIDTSAYGQDLSGRPYVVSLSVLRNPGFNRAFACDAYVSTESQRSCVTVMCGVTFGSTLMGFIAADFDS